MSDTCDCGRIIQQPATGRRRRKCRICSPPDTRIRYDKGRLALVGPSTEQPVPASTQGKASAQAPASPPARPVLPAGPMRAATLLQLRDAGKAETPEGIALLALAEVIDARGGTAQGLVAAIKQYDLSKAALLADVGEDADVIAGIFGTGDG